MIRSLFILILELVLFGGCFGAGYLSRTGNIVRGVGQRGILDLGSAKISSVPRLTEKAFDNRDLATQIRLAEEQRKKFDVQQTTSLPSLPRLDRPDFTKALFAPSDLNLAGVEEAWDQKLHQVVVQTDGEVSNKVKGKLRLEFLKKRGFSAREGSLEEIHALRIDPNYNPEKYMLNYPGGKMSIPTHDENGKPLPEEHIRALAARATQFDAQTILGPYPSTLSEMEKMRLSAGVPNLPPGFNSHLPGFDAMGMMGGMRGVNFGKTGLMDNRVPTMNVYGPLGSMRTMGTMASADGHIGAMGPINGPMGPMDLSGNRAASLNVYGPLGSAGPMGPMTADMGLGGFASQSGIISGVGPVGTMKPGLYMPGSHSKVRQFLDESNPKNPFLVVWDPTKLSASLPAPSDMNPVHERFRKVKGGGHQMWISSKSRNSLEVQGRAIDLATRGYRVFIVPPITMVSTPEHPGLGTSIQSGASIEGKLLVEKSTGLWPLTALRFSGGDLVVEAIGWQGSKILPPMLAESIRTLQVYRPQRIVIRDVSNSYWHLIGPYKASMIPGYTLPQKSMGGIPSFPTQSLVSGKGPFEKVSRFRRQVPTDAPLWGNSAAETGPNLLKRTERHGASELGRTLPVKPSGLFRDTNECFALQQYGREPTKFGLLPTLGSGKLYDLAVNVALKLRERGKFAFVEDSCLGLRILITMYDEMRNDVQCTAVMRATVALKNETGLDEFIRKHICVDILKMPILPAVDLRPLNLALMNPSEIAAHYNLRSFPKVAPYTSRLLGAAVHKSAALQEAVAVSPLAKGFDSKIYRDVCSEVTYTLQELNPFETSSAQQCVESVKAVFGLHDSQWEQVEDSALMDICLKSGYKPLTTTELSTKRIFGYEEIRALFYLEKEHAVHRPYSLEHSIVFESKMKTNPAWCKQITAEGRCIATNLAKKCDGLSATLVNRSQLFSYYSEQILNKVVKGMTIPIHTNTICGIFSILTTFSDDEQAVASTLSNKLGSVFPIYADGQAIKTWRGFLAHEKKVMNIKHISSISELYSKPMKYVSGSDQVLISEYETEASKAKSKKVQKQEESSVSESSVSTETEESSSEEESV